MGEQQAPLILVVDDAPDNVELVRVRLEHQGYRVIAACDGAEALARIKAETPDLVLLDVVMPGIDGIETVRRMRAEPDVPFIPVIMLTAQNDSRSVVAALDAGADEYLAKPFEAGALLARVRSMLRIKALHDQAASQAAQLADWNRSLEQRVAEQVAQLQRMGILRRFLPPQVAELVVTEGEQVLQSHRRNVAVLFCDLRSFTEFSEAAEPEEQMAMLAEFHALLAGVVNRFRGTLVHIAGDGVMVVFNDPVPSPDPAWDAVRAAIEMRAHVSDLTARWRVQGYRLGFGVGIAQGYATLGLIGSDERSQYAATGSVTNLASRLCDAAKDGQILADGKLHASIAHLVEVEELGELTPKGFGRPVRVVNVIELRGIAQG
jgi:class 3 adenylate cyclase